MSVYHDDTVSVMHCRLSTGQNVSDSSDHGYRFTSVAALGGLDCRSHTIELYSTEQMLFLGE